MSAGAELDAQLRELTAETGWTCWRGDTTGSLWAAPPPAHQPPELVNAGSADALRAAITAVTAGEQDPEDITAGETEGGGPAEPQQQQQRRIRHRLLPYVRHH